MQRRFNYPDKLHNVRSLLGDWQREEDRLWLSFNSSPTEMLWFYESLRQRHVNVIESPMVVEFEQAVVELRGRVQERPAYLK